MGLPADGPGLLADGEDTMTMEQMALHIALGFAKNSNDPSTKVGALITNAHGKSLGWGWNRFPKGVKETVGKMINRELKNELIVHAEINALLAAVQRKEDVYGSTIYVAATDGKEECWGGPPCARCTAVLIEAGVKRFVSRPRKLSPTRWQASLQTAIGMIEEAGLELVEIPF